MQCWHELSVLAIPVSIDLFLHVQNEVYFTLEHRNYVMCTFIALWFDSLSMGVPAQQGEYLCGVF